jgi:hypothetical protein
LEEDRTREFAPWLSIPTGFWEFGRELLQSDHGAVDLLVAFGMVSSIHWDDPSAEPALPTKDGNLMHMKLLVSYTAALNSNPLFKKNKLVTEPIDSVAKKFRPSDTGVESLALLASGHLWL